jgi:hypothetical protein
MVAAQSRVRARLFCHFMKAPAGILYRYSSKGDFVWILSNLFNTALSAALQTPLCRMMLGFKGAQA